MPVDASDSSPPKSATGEHGRTAESSPEDRREHDVSPEAEKFFEDVIVRQTQFINVVSYIFSVISLGGTFAVETSYVRFLWADEVAYLAFFLFSVMIILTQWASYSDYNYYSPDIDESPMRDAGRVTRGVAELAGSTPERRARTRSIFHVVKRVYAGAFVCYAAFYGWLYVQAYSETERPLYALWNASLEWFAGFSLVYRLVLMAIPAITVGYAIYKFAPRT